MNTIKNQLAEEEAERRLQIGSASVASDKLSVGSPHESPDTTNGQIKVIVLPSGGSVTIREYVRSWQACLKTSPDVQIKNWDWFPVSVGHVLRGIRIGIHDRINQRGNLPQYDTTSPANQKRYWNRARAKANVHCRHCGERIAFSNIQPRQCDQCRAN